jgi:hypothetical protein
MVLNTLFHQYVAFAALDKARYSALVVKVVTVYYFPDFYSIRLLYSLQRYPAELCWSGQSANTILEANITTSLPVSLPEYLIARKYVIYRYIMTLFAAWIWSGKEFVKALDNWLIVYTISAYIRTVGYCIEPIFV